MPRAGTGPGLTRQWWVEVSRRSVSPGVRAQYWFFIREAVDNFKECTVN